MSTSAGLLQNNGSSRTKSEKCYSYFCSCASTKLKIWLWIFAVCAIISGGFAVYEFVFATDSPVLCVANCAGGDNSCSNAGIFYDTLEPFDSFTSNAWSDPLDGLEMGYQYYWSGDWPIQLRLNPNFENGTFDCDLKYDEYTLNEGECILVDECVLGYGEFVVRTKSENDDCKNYAQTCIEAYWHSNGL
eukprot:58867_1